MNRKINLYFNELNETFDLIKKIILENTFTTLEEFESNAMILWNKSIKQFKPECFDDYNFLLVLEGFPNAINFIETYNNYSFPLFEALYELFMIYHGVKGMMDNHFKLEYSTYYDMIINEKEIKNIDGILRELIEYRKKYKYGYFGVQFRTYLLILVNMLQFLMVYKDDPGYGYANAYDTLFDIWKLCALQHIEELHKKMYL